MKPAGLLVVLSSPSGGGKTTICRALLRKDLNLVRGISVTTRPPRGREKNGREYFFVNARTFKGWARSGKFLEWARVHDHEYGTLKSKVRAWRRLGRDVILTIDVQGGLAVKRLEPDAVLVFVKPPSRRVLAERLRGRGTDSRGVILKRLRNSRLELARAGKYDYVVVNDRLAGAIKNIQAIITAERLKVRTK